MGDLINNEQLLTYTHEEQIHNFTTYINQIIQMKKSNRIVTILLLIALACCLSQKQQEEIKKKEPQVQIVTDFQEKAQTPEAINTQQVASQKVQEDKEQTQQPANFTFDQNDLDFDGESVVVTPTAINQQIPEQTPEEKQLEEEKQAEELKEQEQNLRPWIVQQLKHLNEVVDGIVAESFQTVLHPQTEYVIRWNPPKNQVLSLNIMVFRILDNGEIMLEKDIDEEEFIEVYSHPENKTEYNLDGKVYVYKTFQVNFNSDLRYFKFLSKKSVPVFVVIDMEKLAEIVTKESVAHDQHFLLPLKKLKAIEEQVESGQKIREHTYKYEWGFLENQFSHDSRLLGLTGLELIIIISSALVQLYFIKNLIDNRAIV